MKTITASTAALVLLVATGPGAALAQGGRPGIEIQDPSKQQPVANQTVTPDRPLGDLDIDMARGSMDPALRGLSDRERAELQSRCDEIRGDRAQLGAPALAFCNRFNNTHTPAVSAPDVQGAPPGMNESHPN